MNLSDHRKRIYSQFGEEGVVLKLLEMIGEKNRHCVEIGAGDSLHCSNTRHLCETGWRGLMIEADIDKGSIARKHAPEGVTVLTRAVAPGQLDTIIRNQDFPETYDFLSLDVDGDEWWHFKDMELAPRIVCVEINPSFDFRTQFVQQPGAMLGCSMLAMYLLAKQKHYTPVFYDYPNLWLVHDDECTPLFDKIRYVDLACNSDERLEVASNYRGDLYVWGGLYWGRRECEYQRPAAYINESWPLKKVLELY